MRLSIRIMCWISFLLLSLNQSCHKKSHDDPESPSRWPLTQPTIPGTPSTGGFALTETCLRPLESKTTTQTCEITHKGASEYTYIEGTLLAPTGTIGNGALVFNKAGLIQCTGCDCYDTAIKVDATRLSCPEGLISPALINDHDHLAWANVEPQSAGEERFEHRNDWRGGKRNHHKISVPSSGGDPEVTFGEIRQLMVGTVSIAGSSSAPGFMRNLDDAAFLEGLTTEPMIYDTFPLEAGGDYAFRVGDCAYSRQSSLDYLQFGRHLMHVAEGIDAEARNEFLCLSGGQVGGFDAAKPKNTMVHAIGLLASDAQSLAADGTAVVWSPRSNISLYGNTASVTVLKNRGVKIALGTDWVPSGSAHILREAQCAADFNENNLNRAFTDRDLWLMMTENAASAMKVEKQIGRLAPGFFADVAVYRSLAEANPYRSIMKAEAKDTVLVLRGGKALYGDSELVQTLAPNCAAIDICGQSKALCFDDEATSLKAAGISDLASLIAKMETSASAYPLYFCEKPRDEPSCSAARVGEYAGITLDDKDGDGIKDASDNCPAIFNPIRPLDNGKQADFDGDGLGDACDTCPTGNDKASCQASSADDRDQDGFLDLVDNCPVDPNPLQEDSDKDGIGNSCDACALIPNTGGIACQVPSLATFVTSHDQPDLLSSIKPKASIETRGIVTAIAKTGYYIQDPDNLSAIFVYLPKGDKPLLGQMVRIKGSYDLFAGEAQITSPLVLEKTQAEVPLPQALSSEAVMDSSRVGTLVSFEAKVSDWKNPVVATATPVFALEPAVKIGNFLATYPAPLIGDRLRVTGILRRAGSDYLIEPRLASDILLVESGDARVSSLTPSVSYAEVSSQNVPSLTLTLDRPANQDLAVSLQTSAKSLLLPPSLIIPKGQTSASFKPQLATRIFGGDEGETVAITAILGQSQSVASVRVLPIFKPRVVAQPKQKLNAWVGLTSEVILSFDVPQSFTSPSTLLFHVDNDAIEVVGQPVIASGAQSLAVKILGLKAGASSLHFSMNGSEVSYAVTVRKQDLTLSEVFYDPTGEDNNLEWVEIRNTSGAAIDLSAYTLGAGGVTYSTLIYPLKGILPANGCVVVGGPLSNEKNFAPTFFQAEAFKGGLQNGGANADAIGIFKGNPVDSGNIPVDVFAYGETNKDLFLGPDGLPLTPSLSLVKSGASAERQGQTWTEQVKPTPGDCSALTR